MFIKKSFFRSILIITLLILYPIPTQMGYTNPKQTFSSKEIIERERLLRIFLVNGSHWWSDRFYNILWIEKIFFSEQNWRLSKLSYEKRIHIIKKWQDIIIKRHQIFHALCSLIEFEINTMRDVNDAKQSNEHVHVSNLMQHLYNYREKINEKKKKLEKLDHEIDLLYRVIIEFS
ncbi:hypothetical protein [Bartonella sp. ML70XJBT.G]|uniref:hypothetical protein n=1 Tax=Bartonella sp. ML70XJBT.G TaxID=3019093 RepID=UPI0023613592|nr:hypothetical protein [Bartonella sp. ML70XJBT.G]